MKGYSKVSSKSNHTFNQSNKHWSKLLKHSKCLVVASVVDPDPHRSGTFAWSGSGIIVPDPDPAKHERADK